MLIGGLQKFSLLDYPGKISAIVFTQGCNFRCQFCYNPMLVWSDYAKASSDKPESINIIAGESFFPEASADMGDKLKYAQGFGRESGPELEQQKVHPIIKQDDFFVFLKTRAGKLDAVVITGGEPCWQRDLPDFIKKIKELGFLVKLDTNGTNPEMLAKLIKAKLVDYIAMDLKAHEDKYDEVAGVEVDFNNIKKSVKIIKDSGLPYEFRTTVVPDFLDQDDIGAMGKIITGADLWYLQNFKSQTELVNQKLKGKVPYNARQMNEMAEIGRKYVKRCEVR